MAAGKKRKQNKPGAPARSDEGASAPAGVVDAEAAEPDAEPSPGTSGAADARSPSSDAPDVNADGAKPGAAKPRQATKTGGAKPRSPYRIRGAVTLAVGAIATFLLMANLDQVPRGPLWGMLTMLVATFGLLDMLGLLTPVSKDAVDFRKTWLGPLEGELRFLAPLYTLPLALAILILGGLVGGYGSLPWLFLAACAVLAPAAFRRPGLLVFVVTCAIYAPLLGTYALWDPWETHYGEVSREILSRDDWISLWWAQENWFWSKPILIFWSEALSMGALGVDFHPDANPIHPEWALRLPILLMSLGAVMTTYSTVARVVSRRAGVLAALVLATIPHFFLLAHQAITDMPFVANMMIAMCLLVVAVVEDPDRPVKTFRVFRFSVSAQHALIAGLFLVSMPQVLYLISRNVDLIVGGDHTRSSGFAWHGDQFVFGSMGNGSMPGNSPVRDDHPYLDGIMAQPMTQGLIWLAGLVVLLYLLRRERRAQVLATYGFYVFCGIAFMGKGIPGFALPGLVALLYLVASRRWDVLFEGKLRVAAGALTVLVVGMPWYVAMFIRHGPPFTDRLLVHDHLNRLASGVHGDTGSLEYFLEQMGYGMFPWVALAPAAIGLWLWRTPPNALGAQPGTAGPYRTMDASPEGRLVGPERQLVLILSMWFLGAFTLFNAMVTKFHHYIFPAEPAIAILVGLVLERIYGPVLARRHELVAFLVAAASAAIAVLGVGALWGDLRGVIPEGVEAPEIPTWVLSHGPSPAIGWTLVVGGIALFALAVVYHSRKSEEPPEPRWIAASHGALALAGAGVLAFVGRDLSWVTDARPQGYERLIQLFVYNYGRPWPTQFDYRPILTGFAVVATALTLAMGARRLRGVAARALVALALVFTAWSVDIYLVDLAPHWGQREIIERYYELRDGPEDPIVAYQMNWKGENFYTGNHVAAFVDLDNRRIREWIDQHRGTRAFFVLEHGRLGALRSLVPGREVVTHSTERENNKFVLAEVRL